MMFDFLKSSFSKLRKALQGSRETLGKRLRSLLGKEIDPSTFEQLEQILYESDLGTSFSTEMADAARAYFRENPKTGLPELIDFLKSEALSIFATHPHTPPKSQDHHPHVILIVGVNGSGKTTSVAKLAYRLTQEKKSVLLGAADTFRAAAIEQLDVWAGRLSVPIVKGNPGQDPASVAFDAVNSAKARGIDTVIIDTAGRLQNKTELMQELKKVRGALEKVHPGSPHETLLSLDATTGQNALDQAEIFHQFTPLSGVILNKLDGTAKGGIALALYHRFQMPIYWVGVGETIDDLMPFDPKAYIDALFNL